jgi:hypothetical protein
MWQPPERTKIKGVNVYRDNGTLFSGAAPLTDSMTVWYVGGSAGHFYGRCVNILDQVGFITNPYGPDSPGYTNGEAPLDFFVPPVSSIEARESAGEACIDLLCYPNPFNPAVTVAVNGLRPQRIKDGSITIYSLNGRMVSRIPIKQKSRYVWNAKGCASGIYIVRLSAGRITKSQQLFLVK